MKNYPVGPPPSVPPKPVAPTRKHTRSVILFSLASMIFLASRGGRKKRVF